MSTTTFGNANSGFQAGAINGSVNVQFHYAGSGSDLWLWDRYKAEEILKEIYRKLMISAMNSRYFSSRLSLSNLRRCLLAHKESTSPKIILYLRGEPQIMETRNPNRAWIQSHISLSWPPDATSS